MLGKRIITFFLVLTLVSTTFYLPTFTPPAHAFLFDFTIDIKALAREVADGIAMRYAQKLIDQSVKSTVDWAQNGFDGNPAYAVDPQRFFLSAADQVAGSFIGDASSSLSFLCSPFRTQIRIALRNSYLNGGPQYSCTISGIANNIQAYYNNFDQGGWDTWYTVTQTSGGNPYDAYLAAQADLDSRITNSIGLKKQELDWNSGFLSYKKCLQYGGDPNQTNFDTEEEAFANEEATHTCIEETTVTPGATIKNQLDKVLPVGMEKLITVNHVEQLINAFANGLLKRYVFGKEGLFHKANYNASTINLPDEAPDFSRPAPCNINDPDVQAGCNPNQNPNQDPNNIPPPSANYTISGLVFSDNNGNGAYDDGDSPLSGEAIYLKTADGANTLAVVFTDGSGHYDLSSVKAGSYRFAHTTPQNYIATTDDSMIITLGGASLTVDFGMMPK